MVTEVNRRGVVWTGSNAFPATKVGLNVDTWTAAQKQLVLDAMKARALDAEDAFAVTILNAYANELDKTYSSFTGKRVLFVMKGGKVFKTIAPR